MQNLLVGVPCPYGLGIRLCLFLVSPSRRHRRHSLFKLVPLHSRLVFGFIVLTITVNGTVRDPVLFISIQVFTSDVNSGSSLDLHLTSTSGSLV